MFLQPNANIRSAIAEVTGVEQAHCAAAAGHHAAEYDQLQRVDGADPAARPVEPRSPNSSSTTSAMNFLRRNS
jgi:hypothetical protein